MKHKNPFRGIACSNGSFYGPQFFRHIEGARDSRRAYPAESREEAFRLLYFNEGDIRPFRTNNPIPCAFLP